MSIVLLSELLDDSVTVRGLSPELKARLRVRAAHNARSMEAEARAILEAALSAPDDESTDLGAFARGLFAPLGGVDRELPARSPPRRPLELEEMDPTAPLDDAPAARAPAAPEPIADDPIAPSPPTHGDATDDRARYRGAGRASQARAGSDRDGLAGGPTARRALHRDGQRSGGGSRPRISAQGEAARRSGPGGRSPPRGGAWVAASSPSTVPPRRPTAISRRKGRRAGSRPRPLRGESRRSPRPGVPA